MHATAARQHYEFVEHTADLGLRAWGPDLNTVFEALALGLMETLTEADGVEPSRPRELRVQADDPPGLLQRFLQEALLAFELDGYAYSSAEVSVDGGELTARLMGETFDLQKHTQGREVKAVTHHGLRLETTPRGYEAQVLLDI